MSKSLGFGSIHKQADVANIQERLNAAASMKPQPLSEELPTVHEVERVLATQETTIRQQPLKIARKRQSKGIVQPLNMRVRLATHNQFVELSKTLRLPYDETLEWILARAGVDADGTPSFDK